MTELVWKKVKDQSLGEGFWILDRFVVQPERTGGGSLRGWQLTDKKNKPSQSRFFKNREKVNEHIKKLLASELSPEQKEKVAEEVKMMLHAHRDSMRIRFEGDMANSYDPRAIRFVASEGYYGEAFGIMRGLVVLGFGHFGADNIDEPGNMKFWFNQLCDEVLAEEGFGKDGVCAHCFGRYGRDDAHLKRPKEK